MVRVCFSKLTQGCSIEPAVDPPCTTDKMLPWKACTLTFPCPTSSFFCMCKGSRKTQSSTKMASVLYSKMNTLQKVWGNLLRLVVT